MLTNNPMCRFSCTDTHTPETPTCACASPMGGPWSTGRCQPSPAGQDGVGRLGLSTPTSLHIARKVLWSRPHGPPPRPRCPARMRGGRCRAWSRAWQSSRPKVTGEGVGIGPNRNDLVVFPLLLIAWPFIFNPFRGMEKARRHLPERPCPWQGQARSTGSS